MDANIGNFTDSVNGRTTGRPLTCDRSFYRSMKLKEVHARIERRLRALKMSGNAASKAANKPDAIRNLARAVKSGERTGVSTTTIAALAPVLQTTVAWLTEGTGPEDLVSEQNTIPVWGRAGAGGLVFQFHESGNEIDRIPAPEGSNDKTGALELEGGSLGMIFDNWYVIYDEMRTPPTADLIGQLCIVALKDDRVYVKKLKKGRGKRFTLESNFDPPIYDVEIKWAAPVRSLLQR